MMRFVNDMVPVWVEMKSEPAPGGLRLDWRLEAMMDPEAKHPSGKDHLVKVRYLYVMYSGWVKKERITPR